MSTDQIQAVTTCGCCETAVAPTPAAIQNRAGLSSIQYRVGTYASFLLAMTEQIAQTPELRQRWLVRSTDDFGIALLAMWAYIADILTFYQERTANEAYLRTAVLQQSVTAVAALLDYKPAPGAAAEADLAFFLQPNAQLQIPVGLRVQSVPGQNQKPQKFETVVSIAADSRLNQIQIFPQPTVYAPFAQGSSQAVLGSDPTGLAPRMTLAIFNPLRAELKDISRLSLHNTEQMLAWTPVIQSTDFDAFITQAAVYARQFRPFGYNAPSSYVQAVSDSTAAGGIRFNLLSAPYSNSNLPAAGTNQLALDAKYNDLKPGSTLLIVQAGSTANPTDSFARLGKVTNVSTQSAVYGPLQGSVTWLTFGFGVAATPVVAQDSSGQLHAFVIGDDGALWTMNQIGPGGSWTNWQSLGGQINLLAVGTNQDGRLEVFARGADKALWHIWQVIPSGGWSSWASLNGQIDLLTVASNQDGRLEVFARGTNQALWHIWQTAPNNGWSSWASLGGQIDLLTVGKDQDGRLEVFGRGTDKSLWHIWQTSPNNGWSNWASLGGQFDLLAVANNQDGRLEVFVRGTDLALWHIWQTAPNNGWSGWDSLGGEIDLLAVSNNQDGRLEVFARGTDKSLWHIWQVAPNNGWSSWSSLGGQIDLLGVSSNQNGTIEVFARSTDQALWHIWQTSPNNGWSNWSSLGLPTWMISDPNRVTVYEVSQLLTFSIFQYGDSISGNTVYIPLAQLSSIDNNRFIILDDGATDPQTVQIDSVQQWDATGDGQPNYWQISFTPDLARTLSTATATLYGNVCASTHGQTVANEVLGDGDASTTFQSFLLQKSPVTFVQSPGSPHGVADTLQIQLSGVIWNEVQEFFGHGPTERIFLTSEDAQGMTVQFGDGITGSRLPSGRANVVGTYRQGIGVVGNVAAGALRTLLDRPPGLSSVSNPGPALGGADPESLAQTRSNAPNTVRTFGRIVSLVDFENAASEESSVAMAHASSGWSGEEEIVYLTVAGQGGTAIAGQTFIDLVADLDSRRDPNRAMLVRSYSAIALQIAATIFVNPDYVPADVLASVQSAITSYFAFGNLQFGEPVHLSNVYSSLQGVAGVAGVDITTLQYKYPADATSHGATSDPVQVHLRIYDNELAVLENASDALITIGQVPS